MLTATNAHKVPQEKSSSIAKAYGIAFAALLVLLALVATGANAKGLSSFEPKGFEPKGQVSGPGILPAFAIADFDGDHQADLARVNRTAGSGGYSIDLQLSTGYLRTIPLSAGRSGLSIEARDVDGDGDVDLVVRSQWLRQPVAVFLNDGHGSFSRAAPSLFPSAFAERSTGWAAGTNEDHSPVASFTQFSGEALYKGKTLADAEDPADLDRESGSRIPFKTSILRFAGRAPPLQFPAL